MNLQTWLFPVPAAPLTKTFSPDPRAASAADLCSDVREPASILSGSGTGLPAPRPPPAGGSPPPATDRATISSIASPYLSSFFGPMPLTLRSSSSLRGSASHIPSSAAFVKTVYGGFPEVDDWAMRNDRSPSRSPDLASGPPPPPQSPPSSRT